MIVRNDDVSVDRGTEETGEAERPLRVPALFERRAGSPNTAPISRRWLPGSRSSERHWHEKEEEFLYLISGEATLVENDGEHVMLPGDAACWPAGVPNAHHVINRCSSPCTYRHRGHPADA